MVLLWSVFALLVAVWALGTLAGLTFGGLLHLLPVLAVVLLVTALLSEHSVS